MVVEDGYITWEDKEPTPDPEEMIKETLTLLSSNMDTLLKQQTQLIEMVAKLQKDSKPEAEGSKTSKKKRQPKAKDNWSNGKTY